MPCTIVYFTTCITGGDDYVSGPYSVTFPPGVTNASLDISIIDDNVLEIDDNGLKNGETFALIIQSSQSPHVIISFFGQTKITIEDNDSEYNHGIVFNCGLQL